METVLYKRNPNYPNLFCGTNGLIWSTRSGKFIGTISKLGYITLSSIKINKTRKTLKAHRLIIETFRGESSLCVDHIDGNKTNNNLQNLEYVTTSENTHRAHINGLIKQSGEESSTHKITDKQVQEIRDLNIKGKKGKLAHALELNITIGYYYRVLRREIR